MPLPILQTTSETLLRLFHQTQLRWVQQTSEEAQLDMGTALFNPQLDAVPEANCILEAFLPPGMKPATAVEAAERFYREKESRLAGWVLNPSLESGVLAAHLQTVGYVKQTFDILRSTRLPTMVEASGLKIIPARASFKHARALAEEAAALWSEPQLADAAMLRLDDPHLDALLALQDGRAVASAAVLAVGEIGRIDGVFVAESHRRHGIARAMMGRILESCARSVFKHVMLSVDPHNAAAVGLFRSVGFVKVGEIESYVSAL